MTDWSVQEVELIVADYLAMLVDELVGKPVSKTQHRNALKPLLRQRSEGSIEFKHQNISAVLIKLGLPFIRGYMRRSNYQAMLMKAVVSDIYKRKSHLQPIFEAFAASSGSTPVISDFTDFVQPPPERQPAVSAPLMETARRPIKVNYLEREQRNSMLGLKGEELVLSYEKWRLIRLGKDSLAERVEWVAQYDDGAGFDILSKNEDGTDRFIEVKTTKLTKHTPIFFTKNDYEFSSGNREKFHLYRVFNFEARPGLFSLKGSFDDICAKEAVLYTGRF